MLYSVINTRKGDRKGRGGGKDWFKIHNNQLQCVDIKWIMVYSKKVVKQVRRKSGKYKHRQNVDDIDELLLLFKLW